MRKDIQKKASYSFASLLNNKSKVVTAYISIDTHITNSTKEEALRLLLSDALLSGCKNLTRDEFLDKVNSLGASIGVDVGEGMVKISVVSTAEKFPKLLPLLSAMLTEPTFSPKEIQRIKNVTSNELEAEKDNSKALSLQSLKNSFYTEDDRRYTSSIEELQKTIGTIRPSDLQKIFRIMQSSFWYCTIGGNDAMIQVFEKAIDKIKKNVPFTPLLQVHMQKPIKAKLLLNDVPSRQNIDFNIGVQLPITVSHPDYVPLTVSLAILGISGFSGRLMSTVREKEGLTYGIYAMADGFLQNEKGFWRISTFFSSEKTIQGLTSTFRETSLLFKKGVTQVEVDMFKTILTTKQVLVGDSTAGQVRELHSYHTQDFSINQIDAHKKRISTITLAELQSVIKEYLNPNRLTVSAAGPTNKIKKEINEWFKGQSA